MSTRTEQLALCFDEPVTLHPVDPAPLIVAQPVGYPRLIYVQPWRSVSRYMANRYSKRRHVYCGRCHREYRRRDKSCPHCGAPWNGECIRLAEMPTLRVHTRTNSDEADE